MFGDIEPRNFLTALSMMAITFESWNASKMTANMSMAALPTVSPLPRRIAFFVVRKNGWRDILTIAADTGHTKANLVSVTNDRPLDWSPFWSPDGRFLYFGTDRGGTLGLPGADLLDALELDTPAAHLPSRMGR